MSMPFCFLLNNTPPTQISTLSLHDALPISTKRRRRWRNACSPKPRPAAVFSRSEEHTSELQSPYDLVCRLLLEKKKQPPIIEILPPTRRRAADCPSWGRGPPSLRCPAQRCP